ncbi:MAG: DUF4105 domain-containing protein [Nitrospirota bacterium]|nr:DUF4105 domain-containing protein [Nitrospirota bacterium]
MLLPATVCALLLAAVPARAVDTAVAPDASGGGPYLAELMVQANTMGLAKSREWQVLLHYRKDPLIGYTSEVDGPDFFRARRGKHDPEAELAATLSAFFDPPLDPAVNERPGDPGAEHPQCRMPARYQWLRERLAFDPARLPQQPCPRLQRWVAGINVQKVVVEFPSAYLNNPASMYGHTFLRLDNPQKPDLLDYAINYAAMVEKDPGLLYAVKGIFGLYHGQFGVWPYYTKVQEYGEYENRDIWEYPLTLTPAQSRAMLLHLWELRDTWFDYFFFKENCSYHLLALLEVARPDLHLTERFHVYTIPTDTLRLLVEQPGLVETVTWRPARSSVIRYRRDSMPEEDVATALDVAAGREAAQPDPAPAALSPERWAAVLELADDYLLYQEAGAEEGRLSPHLEETKARILTARSRIGVAGPDLVVPRPEVAPHQGHGTGRLQLGGGLRFGSRYSAVQFRAAYHDFLDPEAGYEHNSRLTFFDIEGRHYQRQDRKGRSGHLELNRLTVIEVFSLYPWDAMFRKPSWRINAGWRPMNDRACPHCGMAGASVGAGKAAEAHWIGRELVYLFLHADGNHADNFRHDHAIGGGAELGLMFDPVPSWKFAFTAMYTGYVLGERFESRQLQARTSLHLSGNVTLNAELTRSDFRDRVGYEGRGALSLFF